MATVLAAVGQARVRKPTYAEGDLGEEEAIELDLEPQVMLVTEQRVRTEAVAMPTTIKFAPSEQTVLASQVRGNK